MNCSANPYIANTDKDIESMLKAIGVQTIEDLFADIKVQHKPKSFELPPSLSEQEVVKYCTDLSRRNSTHLIPFIGAGYYDHYIPSAVNALVSRGEFYTAYTPYQPECAQGTLQTLFEFQSSICTLTEMEVANASLYDGGTALFEAIQMAIRINKRTKIVVDGCVNPIYNTILKTYTKHLNYEFCYTPVHQFQSDRTAILSALDEKTSALILQNPNFFGTVDDYTDIIKAAHDKGILVIMSVYPIALGLIKTPGAMDVDIVTGEGQSLGIPLSFGGPYLGFMATKKKYIRKMPGRIVGETVDKDGRRCFVNTLQAREQHIRREKATSNICTNVSLCAIQATFFMSLMGKHGFKQLSFLNLNQAHLLRSMLKGIPAVTVDDSLPVFNEFVIRMNKSANGVIEQLLKQGIVAGFPLGRYYKGMDDCLLVNATEQRSQKELELFTQALKEVL